MDNLKTTHLSNLLLFGIPFVMAAMGVYFYSQPYTYVVRGEAAIVCDNQKIYPALPNNISDVDTLYAYIERGGANADARETDLRARKLCAYGVIHDVIPFRGAPENRNYSVRLGTSAPALDITSNAEVTLGNQ